MGTGVGIGIKQGRGKRRVGGGTRAGTEPGFEAPEGFGVGFGLGVVSGRGVVECLGPGNKKIENIYISVQDREFQKTSISVLLKFKCIC